MKNKIKKISKGVRGSIGYFFLLLNTLFLATFFMFIGYIKKFSKNDATKKYCLYWLHKIGNMWINVNFYIVKFIGNLKFNIEGLETLSDLPKDKWYLIICNHQSWNDILILQFIFKNSLPFQKYFVKEELRKLPIMGFVWEGLDCPFLKRTNNKNSENNSDIEQIKQKSKRFKLLPCSIVSFVEGTRFTKKKYKEHGSSYKHLLNPKGGGIACVLDELDKDIKCIIDTTLCYTPQNTTFWDLFSGGIHNIVVKIRVIEKPTWLRQMHKDKIAYNVYKDQFQNWLNEIWYNKDNFLAKHYEK